MVRVAYCVLHVVRALESIRELENDDHERDSHARHSREHGRRADDRIQAGRDASRGIVALREPTRVAVRLLRLGRVSRVACPKSVPMLHVACYLLQAGGREGGEERRGEGRGGEGREGGREEVDLSRDLHNLQEESDEAADRRTDHHRRHQRARRNLQTCRLQLARRISAPAGA